MTLPPSSPPWSLPTFLLLLISVGVSSSRIDAAEPTLLPNVIVILTDDQGYADAGFQGSQDIVTPHLDALARSGVNCTNGYVTCSVCAPTRAGLLTGRYQQRFGYEYNSWDPKVGIPPGETTVADSLRAVGYRTLAIGKWHVGQLPQFRPLVRGFTDHYGFLGGGRSFLPLAESQGIAFVPKDPNQVGLWRNENRVADPPHLTDAFGQAAVDYIERYQDQPFFIYLAFNAPHVPLQTTEQYLARYPELSGPRKVYAAMVSAVDDAVGRIEATLAETGLQEDTLIFFLSDNGGDPPMNSANNTPLRGKKSTIYEGGIRVPFVVRWSGHLPAGTTYVHPVVSLDIAATALSLAGLIPSADAPLDGVNLIPFLSGESDQPPHETLYWRHADQQAIRHGQWKLATMPDLAPALFDLSQDVSETNDLAAEHPEIVDDLSRRFDAWAARLPPQFGHPGPRLR